MHARVAVVRHGTGGGHGATLWSARGPPWVRRGLEVRHGRMPHGRIHSGAARAALRDVREARGELAHGQASVGGVIAQRDIAARRLVRARRSDGVVRRLVARHVELGDRASEISAQNRPRRGRIARARVSLQETRDSLGAVAAFLEDLVHKDELPRLRCGRIREQHHGAGRCETLYAKAPTRAESSSFRASSTLVENIPSADSGATPLPGITQRHDAPRARGVREESAGWPPRASPRQ